MRRAGLLRRFWQFLQEPTEEQNRAHLRRIYEGEELISPERHRRSRIFALAYAAIWASGLIVALAVAPGWWRLLAVFIFMLVTPALSDLTESYEDYRREWELGNPRAEDGRLP